MNIDKSLFQFQYLPAYADYLLKNKLEEFVTVGIRFCREVDLPMMRPLAKYSEKQVLELSLESNRLMLTALSANKVSEHIDKNISRYVNNQLFDQEGNKLLDNTEVVAEDIILAFYVRRKLFSFFLHAYTPNTVLHMLIAGEVDTYTSYEHLLTTVAYLDTKSAV